MKIEHIFFDLDHTLWDFEKNSNLTFSQIFKEQDLKLDVIDFLAVYSPINLNYWKLYRKDKVSKEDLRYGRLKDTFDALNYSVKDDVIYLLSDAYIRVLPNHNFLFDGAINLLEYLYPKYKMHIITNGFEEVQNLKLEKSAIRKYFDKIITSEAVGVKKPNSKVFTYSLDLVNAKPQNSIMIGDNLEADVLGALNCGIRAIYFNLEKNGQESTEYSTVSRLVEIKQYL